MDFHLVIWLISLKDNGSKLIRFKKDKQIDDLIKTNKELTELFKVIRVRIEVFTL